MSALRPLLRLDNKLAAETRRISALGGSRSRLLGTVALLGAAALHGALLALPLASHAVPEALLTPRPDLPSVWRWGPPLGTDPADANPAPAAASPAPNRSPRSVVEDAGRSEGDYEPVPEPPPEMASTAFPADVEALIPAPAPIPRSSDDDGPRAVERPETFVDLSPAFRVNPAYPIAARSLRATGSVALTVTLAADGSVSDARVDACTRPGLGFEDAAVAAVRQWRYPAAVDATPLRRVIVRIEFAGQGPQ
jgi:TonB family protein